MKVVIEIPKELHTLCSNNTTKPSDLIKHLLVLMNAIKHSTFAENK